jgi:hypothetical protein
VFSVIQVSAGMLAAVFLPVKAALPDEVMQRFPAWMLLTIAALSVVAVRAAWRDGSLVSP